MRAICLSGRRDTLQLAYASSGGVVFFVRLEVLRLGVFALLFLLAAGSVTALRCVFAVSVVAERLRVAVRG